VEIKRAEGDTAFQRVTNYAKKPGQVAVNDRH
jgi:hypothetical protein